MAQRVSLIRAIEHEKQHFTNFRREAVTREIVDGTEILTLVYSVVYENEGSEWRDYRVAVFTPTGYACGGILNMGDRLKKMKRRG